MLHLHLKKKDTLRFQYNNNIGRWTGYNKTIIK